MTDSIKVTTNNFHYAAWHVRLRAYLIDIAIIYLAILLLVPASFKISSLIMGQYFYEVLQFLLSFDGMWFWVLPLVYMGIFLIILSRTPGMMIMKIKVSNYNGANIKWIQAVLRVFAFVLSTLPCGLGFLPVIWTKKHQGLHDRLTKTLVIKKR